MTIKKLNKSLTTIIFVLFLFSNKTSKAEGFYAGLGYLKSDLNKIQYSDLTYTAHDDKDNGFSLFIGYDLNKNVGIEAGYNDLGKSKQTVDDGGSDLNAVNKVKVTTIAGILKTDPIDKNLVFFIKGGLARIDHDEKISGTSTLNTSLKSTNLFYGVGANYEISNGFAIRAAYEIYGKDDGLSSTDSAESKPDRVDPKMLSIALIKRF